MLLLKGAVEPRSEGLLQIEAGLEIESRPRALPDQENDLALPSREGFAEQKLRRALDRRKTISNLVRVHREIQKLGVERVTGFRAAHGSSPHRQAGLRRSGGIPRSRTAWAGTAGKGRYYL